MTDLYPNIGQPQADGQTPPSAPTPAQVPAVPTVPAASEAPRTPAVAPVIPPTASPALTPEEKGAALMGGTIPANPLTERPATPAPLQAPTPVMPIATVPASSAAAGKSITEELADVPVGDVLAGETPRIHTFADDVKRALSQDRMSISKIAMEEQKRRDQQAQITDVSARNPRNMVLLFVSLVLLLGGGGTIWYFMTQVHDVTVPTITDDKRILVGYDNRIDLTFNSTTRSGIAEDISNVATQPLTNDTITAIVYRQDLDLVDPRLFLLRLQSRAPESLIRSLDAQFLLGIYSGKVNSPFLLLKSASYETAYSGMLSWEKDLAVDMDGIIYRKVQTLPDADGIIQPSQGQFIDRVIANRDARAYIDATGRMLFYYAFVTNNLIIIAQNETALSEVISRAQQESFKR